MAKQIIIKGTPVVGANEVLVADSNSKIPAVDGSQVTTMAGGNIAGTIPTARLDTGTTANKLVVIGGSGLPAVDGSLLTGIESFTKNASDPTITTNPSGGVGTEWVNTTTGRQFICTNATAGANIWKCTGGGYGDIKSWAFQGFNYGFSSGGTQNWSAPTDQISKFSLSSDADSVDVANITDDRQSTGGCSSATHGYNMGGYHSGYINVIDKFSFTSGGDSTAVGELSVVRASMATQSSEAHAYAAGGDGSGSPSDLSLIHI